MFLEDRWTLNSTSQSASANLPVSTTSPVTVPPPEDLLLVRNHLKLGRVNGFFGSGAPDGVPYVTISGSRAGTAGIDRGKTPALKLQMVVRDSEKKCLYVRLGAQLRAAKTDAFTETTPSGRQGPAPFELQITLKQLQSRKLSDYKAVVLDLDDTPLVEGPFQQVGSP